MAWVRLFSPANDKLGGSGEAGIVLEFLNLFGFGVSGVDYEADVDPVVEIENLVTP